MVKDTDDGKPEDQEADGEEVGAHFIGVVGEDTDHVIF